MTSDRIHAGFWFLFTAWLFQLLILVVACLIISSNAFAADDEAGRIVDVRGDAWVAGSEPGAAKLPAEIGMVLNPGDTVITGPTGRLFILCADESLIQIHYNTSFVIDQVAKTAG